MDCLPVGKLQLLRVSRVSLRRYMDGLPSRMLQHAVVCSCSAEAFSDPFMCPQQLPEASETCNIARAGSTDGCSVSRINQMLWAVQVYLQVSQGTDVNARFSSMMFKVLQDSFESSHLGQDQQARTEALATASYDPHLQSSWVVRSSANHL